MMYYLIYFQYKLIGQFELWC